MEKILIWRGSEVKEYEITPLREKLISQNVLYQLLRFDPAAFYLLLTMTEKDSYTQPELEEGIKRWLDPRLDNISQCVSKSLDTLMDLGIVGSDWKIVDDQYRKVYFVLEKK
jgi:hypothetical protein